jgi:hypothetical protein
VDPTRIPTAERTPLTAWFAVATDDSGESNTNSDVSSYAQTGRKERTRAPTLREEL